MEKRDMDVGWLVKAAKQFAVEYDETEVMAFGPRPEPEVQVGEWGLLEVAAVEDWEWFERPSWQYPHLASVMVDGVKFYTILTDEEKRGVLDGTLFQEDDETP